MPNATQRPDRILVVDDDARIRDLLKRYLTQEGLDVLLAAALLLAAAVTGKLIGVHLAGRILRWGPGEASLIGWLLQTKALIMIIFANVLLDRAIISSGTFTALLLMAVASTMITIPMVEPRLASIRRAT